MRDLQQNLVGGQGRREGEKQKKRFEQIQSKIKTLRNKNNELQKQCDNQLDNDIRTAIKSQTGFLENEIKDIKKGIEQLTRDYKDIGSKNKIKELCGMASREMQRNKRIMQQYMNRASSSSMLYKGEQTNAYRKSRTQFNRQDLQKDNNKLPSVRQDGGSIVGSQQWLSDMKAQQRMLAERNALLKELQQKNNAINNIIRDMGEMVGGQQADAVNQIGHQIETTYQNTLRANEELQDGLIQQKKARKKYTCIVIGVVFIIVVLVGILVLFIM